METFVVFLIAIAVVALAVPAVAHAVTSARRKRRERTRVRTYARRPAPHRKWMYVGPDPELRRSSGVRVRTVADRSAWR